MIRWKPAASVPFEIYSDEPENVPTSKSAAAPTFEIYCDENALTSRSKNPSTSGPAPFEIYCDEEPEKVLAKPDFVKPLPMPKFCLRQPLTCDDRENKLGECCSQCFTVKMQLG